MRVTFSNTGLTITLTFDQEAYDSIKPLMLEGRINVEFDENRLYVVKPDRIKAKNESGRWNPTRLFQRKPTKMGALYIITFPPKQFPTLPIFGKVTYEGFTFEQDTAYIQLPTQLGAPEPRGRRKEKVVETATAASRGFPYAKEQVLANLALGRKKRLTNIASKKAAAQAKIAGANAVLIVEGTRVSFHLPSTEGLKLALQWTKEGYLEDVESVN